MVANDDDDDDVWPASCQTHMDERGLCCAEIWPIQLANRKFELIFLLLLLLLLFVRSFVGSLLEFE